MTETEYREFLTFLFERYVRPRLNRVRERHRHHFEDAFDECFCCDGPVASKLVAAESARTSKNRPRSSSIGITLNEWFRGEHHAKNSLD